MSRTFSPTPESRGSRWLRLGMGAAVCVPLILVAGILLFPPVLAYEVFPDRLAVYARAGVISHSRTIPLERIEETRPARLTGGLRTAGTGLPGFCAGTFRYPSLGSVWQATSCVADVVLLRVRGEDRPLLVSPAQRFAFMDSLRSRTAGTFGAAPAGSATVWRVLLPLIGLFPIPILALFFLAPGRLRYRLDGGALEVRTLLRRVRFPLAGTKARRYRPARGWRMFGVGLPGYATGWFRFDGVTTRVYASGRDGVLIEGEHRLFVTPADRDGFLAALADAGAAIER